METAQAARLTAATGGALLVAGSLLPIAVRLVAGWTADQTERPPLGTLAVMPLCGAAGYTLLASLTPQGVVVGVLAAFGLGLGFVGLLFLALLGLLMFGFMADAASLSAA
ncbi:MAG: hypothetical protein ACRDQB_05500 [Thermocrispum sp.]